MDTLQEYCIQAAVGMDCWQLELQERYTQRLTEMAETQGLCENCLKSVRKLTIEHESLGELISIHVLICTSYLIVVVSSRLHHPCSSGSVLWVA